METLAQAIVEVLASIELTGDELIDPDYAVDVISWTGRNVTEVHACRKTRSKKCQQDF